MNREGVPSGPVGGGGVGRLPHQGYPTKHPFTNGILVIDDIHKRRLAGLRIFTHECQ